MRTGFLPPDSSELMARLAARNSRRARRVVRELRLRAPGWRLEAARALSETLGSLRGPRRVEFLNGPELRGWLSAAEEALLLGDPDLSNQALFHHLSRGPHLVEVTPQGRIDRGFRRRAVSLASRLLETVFLRLPPVLAFLTPPGKCYGPFPLDLAPDGEEARCHGEIHVRLPVHATLKLAPGAGMELADGGIRMAHGVAAPRWTLRELIEGSPIVLARSAISTRRGLRPGATMPRLGRRLGRALALIGGSWKHGHDEVLRHTSIVVPLIEKGTISYSMPDRPGVSYLNVDGKSLVELADDLLHETAHHRLHGLEELDPLDRDDGEPRYDSPWRGGLRPLRGILHAAYTFTWRAELLRRLLDSPAPVPRSWLRKELSLEAAALRKSMSDLADAQRRGLLTQAGSRLCSALAKRISGY